MVSANVECIPAFEYSEGRFFGTDCDRDRFIESIRREAEGFCRCGGEDDDEAWLSEVDAINLRL